MARKGRHRRAMPWIDRRTFIVLASLAVSMSGVSGLLLLLEPTPLAPVGGPVLTMLDPDPDAFDRIFETRPGPDPNRWQAIVIHHSGRSFGSARTLSKLHQSLGYGGLGYHFVVGNGDGADDGEIHVGYRWTHQLDGRHVQTGDTAVGPWFNRHAIGICLIGNGDRTPPTDAQLRQLVRLVTVLQERLNIPPDRVLLHSNIDETTSPGVLFPAASFRRQLVDTITVDG